MRRTRQALTAEFIRTYKFLPGEGAASVGRGGVGGRGGGGGQARERGEWGGDAAGGGGEEAGVFAHLVGGDVGILLGGMRCRGFVWDFGPPHRCCASEAGGVSF